MNLYALHYFVTLAHLEHYTQASKVLGISQPALTHAIRGLEDELGIRLFAREGRNVSLTRAGEFYLKQVEEGLTLLENANQAIRRLSQGEGEIRLGFLRESGVRFLPTLIHDFIASKPDAKIHFALDSDSGMSTDLLEGLRQGRYDLIFSSAPRQEEDLLYVPVYRQPLYLAVPAQHPFACEPSIRFCQLVHEPMILFSSKSGLRYEINRLLAQAKMTLEHIVFEISEDEVIASFVEKGFGFAILPDIPIIHQVDVSLVRLEEPQCYREMHMIMKKKADHYPVVQAFFDFVRQNVSALNDDGYSVETGDGMRAAADK